MATILDQCDQPGEQGTASPSAKATVSFVPLAVDLGMIDRVSAGQSGTKSALETAAKSGVEGPEMEEEEDRADVLKVTRSPLLTTSGCLTLTIISTLEY